MNELTSSAANFYTYADEAKEQSTAPQQLLDARSFSTKDDRSAYEQNVSVPSTSPYAAIDNSPISSTTAYVDAANQNNWDGTGAAYPAKSGESVQAVTTTPGATLYDVAKGNITLPQFVAGLSVTQLGNIVEGSSTLGSTPSAVGAAGYTTPLYENLGIPGMVLSDGPAGLRITQQIAGTPSQYQWATAWPVGTMLAQTWNRPLVQQVGDAVGKEMEEYGVTMWLAPGMNIHRDPAQRPQLRVLLGGPAGLPGLTAAADHRQGVQSNPRCRRDEMTAHASPRTSQEAGPATPEPTPVVSERALRRGGVRTQRLRNRWVRSARADGRHERRTTSIDGTCGVRCNYDLTRATCCAGSGAPGSLVMSDWGGSHSAVASMYSGYDLIEPGGNPNEVINATKQSAPTIDLSGLPAYNARVTPTRTTYTWSVGSLTLSATGSQTIATTVDQSTDLSKTPLSGTTTTDAGGHTVFTPNARFASVDDAYKAATALLTGSVFNATQKAAISISNVVHTNPADSTSPVTAYTVTLTGNYPASYDMRLGDLQRSAMRILTAAMHSEPFAQLATAQGVSGINVGPYENLFGTLPQVMTVDKSTVKGN